MSFSEYWSRFASLFWLLLLLSLTSAVYLNPELLNTLRYERALFNSEWWRLPGHALAHLNLQHLLLNLSALVLIYYLFNEAFKSSTWTLVLLLSAIGSSLGLYYYSPATQWCAGLSGALHGLMIYAVLRSRAHWLWVLAIFGKIVAEQLPALHDNKLMSATENFIQSSIVVDAHLWGAVAGLAIFGIIQITVWARLMVELNRSV